MYIEVIGLIDVSDIAEYERAEDLGMKHKPEIAEVKMYIDVERIVFFYDVPEVEWADERYAETMIVLDDGSNVRVAGDTEDVILEMRCIR